MDLPNWFLNPFIFLESTAFCDREFYKCKLCEEVLLCVLQFVISVIQICVTYCNFSCPFLLYRQKATHNFVLVHLSFLIQCY